MENNKGAGSAESERIYEDFEPFCKWHRHDMVEVHLHGFRKEHLRVQTSTGRVQTSTGILTIHGERPLNETTWSRFHKEIKLADTCNPNEVRAKLAGGVLTVTMPDKVIPNPPKKTTSTSAADDSNAKLLDKEQTSCELRGGQCSRSSRFTMGKNVAVKIVVAVAVVVAFGFGTYVVKNYIL